MRIALATAPPGRCISTRRSSGDRLFAGRRGSQTAMRFQHLGDLPAECQVRVERARRVLEHHADPLPANRAKLARPMARRSSPRRRMAPPLSRALRRQQPHDGARRASFCPSRIHRPGRALRPAAIVSDTSSSTRTAVRCAAIIEAIVFDGEDRLIDRSRGLSASRRPSPSRLKPIAVRAMAAPGATIIHGA